LEKMMEKTSSVFWVDLGYKLRSRDTVPLQGSGGWLTSHLLLFHCSTLNYCLLLLTT